MTLPKIFTDHNGHTVTVESWDSFSAQLIVHGPSNGPAVRLLFYAEHIDPLYAALREAVGRPAPIVHDRTRLPDRRITSTGYGVFSVSGGTVRLTSCCAHCGKDSTYGMLPAAVRNAAAALAEMADTAEAEPGPEDVEALTEWFEEQDFVEGGAEDLARAFLHDWEMPEEREA